MSMSTRSGRPASALATPSTPLTASMTSKPAPASVKRAMSLKSSSSSTTRTRLLMGTSRLGHLHGKLQMKNCTLAQGRLDPDAAAVHLDNLLGDGQAKPSATLCPSARTIHLVEFLEDALLLLEWNARPRVAHRNEKLTIGAARRHAHFTAVCELDRIA